jgi:hypothetical protein
LSLLDALTIANGQSWSNGTTRRCSTRTQVEVDQFPVTEVGRTVVYLGLQVEALNCACTLGAYRRTADPVRCGAARTQRFGSVVS